MGICILGFPRHWSKRRPFAHDGRRLGQLRSRAVNRELLLSRAIHKARSHDGPTYVFTNSALPWRYPVPHHHRKQELFLRLQLVNFAVPACGVLSLQGCNASHDGWLFVAISTGGLSKSSLMNRNQTSPLMQQHLDDRCDVKPTVDRSAAYTGH